MTNLPELLRPLFWDHDFDALRWEEHRDLVVSRVLSDGDLAALQWLRARLGDGALRRWIERRGGRGLDARRLRFWELVLELPHGKVDAWLADPSRRIWKERSAQARGEG